MNKSIFRESYGLKIKKIVIGILIAGVLYVALIIYSQGIAIQMYWLQATCENTKIGETYDIMERFKDYYIVPGTANRSYVIYAGYFARDFAFLFAPSCFIIVDQNNIVTFLLWSSDS